MGCLLNRCEEDLSHTSRELFIVPAHPSEANSECFASSSRAKSCLEKTRGQNELTILLFEWVLFKNPFICYQDGEQLYDSTEIRGGVVASHFWPLLSLPQRALLSKHEVACSSHEA